jgi:hypothetical protein
LGYQAQINVPAVASACAEGLPRGYGFTEAVNPERPREVIATAARDNQYREAQPDELW